LATLVTRCIGDLPRDPDDERFLLDDDRFADFFALRFPLERLDLPADLRALERFAEPRFADFFAPRLAPPRFADFFAPRFAPPRPAEDRFEPDDLRPDIFFLAAMTDDSWIRELEPEVTCKKQARQSGHATFLE
jgi:hypothetical protein